MLSIIVAKAKNNVIGKDNKLIWNVPDDLKRFRTLTSNHTIIMGRKTFESIGRVLPNRKHVILSRNKEYKIDNPNVEIVSNINELDKYINDENENFVIGGANIYTLLMNKCNKMYITEIEKDFDGDAVFPEINENEWKIECKEKGPEDGNEFDYYYIDYIRI